MPDAPPAAGARSSLTESDTLAQLLAARWPADPATVLVETPDGARITYREAWARAGQLANALVDLGVRPGDRVAVQVEKSPLVVLLYLACVRSGAVLLPLNPAYTDDETEYLIGDAEPAVLVRDPSLAEAARPTTAAASPALATAGAETAPVVLTADAAGGGTLAELAAGHPSDFADVARGPDDLAALVYTSGTTGRPKGAMLTHRNLASNAVTLHRIWGFRPDDVLLHALPLFHVHGLFVALNCVLANGTGMVLLPRFDVDAVLDNLDRCTVLMGVPTFYTRLLADPRLDTDRCRSVRLFVSGSAPLLAATHTEFRRRTGHTILERYGMTETSMITSNPLDGERRPGTVGLPLPGVDVRIAAPSANVVGNGPPRAVSHDISPESPESPEVPPRPVPPGGVVEVGEVEVRGPNVCAGYWRRPEATAAVQSDDGWFRTGDLGSLDADGYLTLVSRTKDLIISGGLNVYPREVEAVLDQLDGVAESAVVGVPDPDFGEAVVAVVVPEPGRTIDAAQLRATARQRLAPFKVPKRVEVAAALPRNAMGKVEKARLRTDLTSPPPA